MLPTEWAGEGTMAGRRKGNAPYPAFAGWTVRKLWAEIGRRRIVARNNAKKAALVCLLVQDTARLTGNFCRASRGRRVAAQSDGQAGEPLLASTSDETPAPQVRDEDDSDKVAYLQRTVNMLQSSFAELSRIVTESLQEKRSKSTLSGTEGAEFSAGNDRQQRDPCIPLATSGGAHYVTGASGPSRESPHVGRNVKASAETPLVQPNRPVWAPTINMSAGGSAAAVPLVLSQHQAMQGRGVSVNDIKHVDIVSPQIKSEIWQGKDINLATLLIPGFVSEHELSHREMYLSDGVAVPLKPQKDARLLNTHVARISKSFQYLQKRDVWKILPTRAAWQLPKPNYRDGHRFRR